MANSDRKRQRNSSETNLKSPSETQKQKKVKQRDISDDCGYMEESDKTNPTTKEVSEIKMAAKSDSENLVDALIVALQNPSVINKLKTAIFDKYEKEVKTLKEEIFKRDIKIQNLEEKLESEIEALEMYGRRNGITIHGVKEELNENTDKIVLKLAKELKAEIPTEALGRSHRVGPKSGSKPRAIIAKFIGHNYKVEMLKHKKNLKTHPDGKKIFINEDLTKTRADWARRARNLRKLEKIKDTWTRDGVIFIKHKKEDEEDEETPYVIERVDSELKLSGIEEMFGVNSDLNVMRTESHDSDDE